MKNALNTIKNAISKALSAIVDCIIPTLPVLIGAGMIKVLLIILGPLVFNILSEDSNTYIVLEFVADAGYYFLPIYVAVSSAEVFKTDKYIAAFMGAILISPTFVELVIANHALSVFGLPIALTDYNSQIIPSIIIVCILSYVYNFIDSHIGYNAKPIVVPLLTMIVMTPIVLCAVGPLGVFLGNGLVNLIMWLKNLGPIGNGIMCAIIPYITITGLGGANISAMLALAASGCDPILFFSNVIYNNVIGFIALAMYCKNKKPDPLAAAITACVAGISEAALFGNVVKNPKALLTLSFADFCAGLYTGLMGVKSYAMASFGIFGIITTIGPGSSIIHAIIAMIIGCSIGFIITFLTYKEK